MSGAGPQAAQAPARAIPDWARHLNVPHASATPERCIKWITGIMALYCRDLVVLEMHGQMSRRELVDEMLLGCAGLADLIPTSETDAVLAARAAMVATREAWGKFQDDLRRRIWPLGRSGAPGPQIVAVAHAVNDQHGWWLPSDLLIDAARRIAHSAVRRPRRGRR